MRRSAFLASLSKTGDNGLDGLALQDYLLVPLGAGSLCDQSLTVRPGHSWALDLEDLGAGLQHFCSLFVLFNVLLVLLTLPCQK